MSNFPLSGFSLASCHTLLIRHSAPALKAFCNSVVIPLSVQIS
nr:MAG TPA: hypothetical protein [Herelleviridae sp.]